ncbi:helix-turn-helix transcriptional regulator [Pyrococcus horikoshii]|nr:winged helix-turn-helix transcriptional regulator [Pyrococcus horikoshii]HII61945.1 winged helix-turn-helix transcriptional regulator [Pyrococcus horikoshii]
MNFIKKVGVSIMFLTLFLSFTSAYIVENMTIFVWRDGSITVKEVIYPEDYEVFIKVPTLGKAEDILVISDNRTLLEYESDGSFVKIETLDVRRVTVIYTVKNYVKREGALWTLKFNVTQAPVKVILPLEASVISISDLPIAYSNDTIVMGPGNVTICYTFKSLLPKKAGISHRAIAGAIILVAITAGILALKGSKREERKYSEDKLRKLAKEYNLNDDELNAIIYLIEKGGKCRQAELRKALNLPKTTVWRMIRRLEQMGLVKLYKVGRENWVELAIDMQRYA